MPQLCLPDPQMLTAMLSNIDPRSSTVTAALSECGVEYTRLYSRFGTSMEGELSFRHWFKQLLASLQLQSAQVPVAKASDQQSRASLPPPLADLEALLSPSGPPTLQTPAEVRQKRLQAMLLARRASQARERQGDHGPALVAPLFIVSPPRSGSTLLFELLKAHPDLWSIGGEAHDLVETIPGLHPADHGWRSNSLSREDATDERIFALHQRFGAAVVNWEGSAWRELDATVRPAQVRLLEKTPKNALRIGFWHKVFPDARFLFLVRDAAPTLSSMLACWRSERFVAYSELPGWPHGTWSLLLPSGWSMLREKSLAQIVAWQWHSAMSASCDQLETLPRFQWHVVQFERLVREPRQVLTEIANFSGISLEPLLVRLSTNGLPLSSMVQTVPDSKKWQRDEPELRNVLTALDALQMRAKNLKK